MLQLALRDHPRRRMIQSPPLKLNLDAMEYWMPAFAA